MQGRCWRRFMSALVSVNFREKTTMVLDRSRACRAALILVLSATLLPGVCAATADDHWSDRFDALGLNGPCFALTDDGNGNVFAGGDFTIAGGDTVNRVALFDGNFWAPYGAGIGGTVHALAFYQGSLIAGGAFTTAGGHSIPYIARWDGSDWVAMGAGLNGPVDALLVMGADLYVGGEFNASGATS